jgi:hypothetical protein
MISFVKLQKTLFLIALFLTATNAQAANQKPIANAGENQTVGVTQKITLSAQKSVDNDGVIKSYRWLQTKGIRVKLSGANTAQATFIAPKKSTTLVFKVTVIDDKKARSSATVEIVVSEKWLQSKFNDTGITFCFDGAFNLNHCNILSYPRQDAEFGRDVENNDDKDGHAGFSFSKIDENGKTLPLEAKNWACVKDNVTGFLWEVKTQSSPRYRFDETAELIKQTNDKNLCGQKNWRLPQIQELQTIVNYGENFPNPAIDFDFFPDTVNQMYWTKTPYLKNDYHNWVVHFDDGRLFEQNKTNQAAVRLISNENQQTSQYILLEDGAEVLDTKTGLIWRRCVEGMRWNGKSCDGFAFAGMFVESLERAAMQAKLTGKNWRLPNVKELSSLVDFAQEKLAIDETIFPQTLNDQFWSSSVSSFNPFYGWVTHFYYGSSYYTYIEAIGRVRLVR